MPVWFVLSFPALPVRYAAEVVPGRLGMRKRPEVKEGRLPEAQATQLKRDRPHGGRLEDVEESP